MGAFFIYNRKQKHNYDLAINMFKEMGFRFPEVKEVGDYSIIIYSKITDNKCNLVSNGELSVASVGSFIYKGMNCSDSLLQLLSDYMNQCISYDKMIGQYTLLFCHSNSIEILCDPLGCKHVFSDRSFSMISSHMLPICQCLADGLHINRHAFYEKFLTGIIMPPNTLFEEIVQINNCIAEQVNKTEIKISFAPTSFMTKAKKKKNTFRECLAEQADNLHGYFELLRNSSENGVDMGLSGGYDSRLVLACIHQYLNENIHLHSHSTEHVHDKDLQIAKQMADYIGVPCHIVPTKTLEHCNNVDEILRKSVLYFDGRSSFSIGGCGEVYTAIYREKSTEQTPFTLTGVGGELYRNVFNMGFRKYRLSRFMEKKIFSLNFRKALPDNLYQEVKKSIVQRAAYRLNISEQKKQSKEIAYRYYCEIMMPDGQGNALDAYNQVSCCIAPFLEYSNIIKGYEAIPFHHSGGFFEGELINYIDKDLASISSTYGYPINKRPIKAKIKESLREYIPVETWNKLSTIVRKRKREVNITLDIKRAYANSLILQEAYNYMIYLFPEIDFGMLLQSNEELRKIQFVAMTIYLFRERIITK